MLRPALSFVVGLLALLALAVPAAHAQSDAVRAVLVTGASSGLGRRMTERLAANGFYVYAGARRPEDIAELSRIPNVQGIRLDVTVASDIAAAVETVTRGGRGLYGLVNNAGIAILAPLIEVDERELLALFDVNVHGVYRVTKAFAPLLLASRGRVVITSSISGILSGAMLGPYSMSKHAVEAYGDALGAELAPFGVRVSLIEPGNYRSDIGRNVLARVPDLDAAVRGSRFEAQLRASYNAMNSYETGVEPDAVADAALDALAATVPRPRYMVVPSANQALVTIRKAIDELVQLNEGHGFTYDRDALIQLLDESIARAASRR
jgi:NAD(P)-dependent dehydrogenase (short-subunit alcohol dehydrogenase family)